MVKDIRTEEFTLPFPPSVNHYWRNIGNRAIISREGREYRESVRAAVWQQRSCPAPICGAIEVSIFARVPDKRRRDVDNMLKAVLDSLETAGAYKDDSQVLSLTIRKCALDQAKKPGYVRVTITGIDT